MYDVLIKLSVVGTIVMLLLRLRSYQILYYILCSHDIHYTGYELCMIYQ